jgi:hypothetical protein
VNSNADHPSAPLPQHGGVFRAATAVVFIALSLAAAYELSAGSWTAQLEISLMVVPAVLCPGALLVLGDTKLRFIVFVIALMFGFGTQTLMYGGGPDSPALLIPWFGYCTAAGALLTEILMLMRRLFVRLQDQ